MRPESSVFSRRAACSDDVMRVDDVVRRSLTQMLSPFMELLEAPPASSRRASRTTGGLRDSRSARGGCATCGCSDCRCEDPCESTACDPCRCCIGNVDLVAYARPGERRVIPLVVENPRARERTVTFSLSRWTTCDGRDFGVVAGLSRDSLVLGPCSEGQVLVTVQIPGAGAKAKAKSEETAGADKASHQSDVAVQVDQGVNEVRGVFICGCEVLYANLSMEGCRHRPITIALAILANDCSPHEVSCSCCEC